MHAVGGKHVADRRAAAGIAVDEYKRMGLLHRAFSLLDFA
jgi:hypothetical protein